ncbi:MAG: response regulator [Gemmatimonadetes bacterium]|nr:response regulator [Gemmatimonadota bacterium]
MCYFPAAEGGIPAADRPRKAVVAVGGSETILVVEDEAAVRRLVLNALTRLGYHVHAAADGAEALDLLDGLDGELHLLLTDVVLLGMNGMELYRAVANRRPSAKVLFMSGYADDVLSQRGILDDSIAFLQKPFTVASLGDKVREVLGAS